MALRMALFRPAQNPSEKKARTKSAPRTGTRNTKGTKGSTGGRTGRSGTRTGAKASAKTKAAPNTAVRGRSLLKGRTAPGTKAAGKDKGTAKAAPRKRAATGGQGPPPPVLQRHTIGPALARAAVMAVALVCMVGFAVALAKVTLVPSPASDRLVHTNLRPGASIRAYLDQPALRDSVKQIGGNVLLGVPFGVLLPMLFPRTRGLVRVAIVTALVMVVVESAQGAIVEGRAFDIDDVILNTLGALLGYLLLGRRLGRALHPRREHWWHRYGFTRDRPPARTRQ